MTSPWTTFTAPNTSTGQFNADIMILLTDGSVLIHNGYVTNVDYANQWLRLTPDVNGNYATGNWSGELDMQYARQWFASGVLPDGRVFCVGGEDTNDPSYPNGEAASGEIFDPTTNTWTPIIKPTAFEFVRGDCNGSVMADGRVLIGGASPSGLPPTWSAQTAIWDAIDNTWVQAGLEFGTVANTKTDSFEEESWALLADGSILAPAVRDTPGAQRYIPSLDQWVASSPSPQNLAIVSVTTAAHGTVGVYETGAAIALPGGGAYAVGGSGQTAVFTPPLTSNPTGPGSWTQGPAFPADKTAGAAWPTLTALDAPAAVLPNGRVVMLAGSATYWTDGLNQDYFSSNPVFFYFDPTSGATTTPKLEQPTSPALPSGNQTWQSCFLILPSGQLLCSTQSNTLYLYTPSASDGAPDPSWAPSNIQVSSLMVTGHSYSLSGTQINGLSQACCYGDDAGMATNYPIVRLTSLATGTITYLRSYNFSTMSIAPSTAGSCQIDIPASLAAGDYNLVVIANGIPSQATTVQIATQDCYFILDNSTFSVGEVDTYVKAMPPVNALFTPAFYVVVEGYTPSQIGINTGNPIGPQLAKPPILPNIPSPFPGDMQIAFAGPMIPENPVLPPTPQRFTFPFSITFLDDSMFTSTAQNVTLTTTFSASGDAVSNSAVIELIPNPNPYILHGDQTLNPPEPWYLSQDLRVFQMIADPSQTKFGLSVGTSGSASSVATAFIQGALNNLRNNVGTARADFAALPQNESTPVLQLQPTDPTTMKPVYNFAIAQVRLRDTQNAPNVRVFFRIWQAQQTNASYNSTTYARAMNTETPAQPIPVLGVQGDEIITIPFFAQPRVLPTQQLHTQQDDFNRHDIDATPGGETDYFFGCWLDINQPDLVYPQRIVGVSGDGPFNTISPLFPIQQFMVAAHQCLIAEIAFDPDPIAPNSDPSNSDKLAQRNLAFTGAPNPGNPLSLRVPQTFEVKPTQLQLPVAVKPDELMVEWDNVPAGSFAEVYLPAVSADAILGIANTWYTSHLLTRGDAHTLRFPASGVTYIPIPPGAGVTYAGLLTLDLPSGIEKGDTYTAVVRQITSVVETPVGTTKGAVNSRVRQWRRTTGTFKLTIPVSTKTLLLEPEEQYFSIMKNTFATIPTTSRWYPVMQRYLKQLAGRVTFMGGDPAQIPPTFTGIWKTPVVHPLPEPKRRFIGKIDTVLYDHFGDFEGFTMESERGEIHSYESRERPVEDLARRAWQDRFRVMLTVDPHHPHRPLSIVLLL